MQNNVNVLRAAKGLSQDELSELTGISQTMISAFERGIKDITLTRAKRLAAALGCSIEDLTDNIADSEPEAI